MLTPKEVEEARASGVLHLRGRNLPDVPPEIFDISSLHELDLSGNQIAVLPPGIEKLTRLQVLHLKGNRLSAVPPQLGGLRKLRVLDLNDNEIRRLPRELARLQDLRVLTLARNRLDTLPRVVPELLSLEALWLEGNQLTHLPETVGRLRHLTQLRLGGNQLTAVPREIGALARLTTLQCEDNQITELPDELRYLANLHLLRLDGNQIAEFPAALTELTDLRQLDLAGNQVTSLPSALAGQLERGLKLTLTGNPLKDPLPAALRSGTDALIRYLRELDSDGEQFYEAKVMVLGEGFVGKTSLIAALLEQPFQQGRPPTPGIAVSLRQVPCPGRPGTYLTLRLWDFGGQDDYLVTHQLFISRRAVYLVVWNMRQGLESADIPGRLRAIQLRLGAAASDGSVRVLIVGTHRDETRSSVDYGRLRTEFPGILAGHFEVDSATESGIDELRDAIAREAAGLPRMGEALPAEWTDARREVLALAQTRPYIELSEFTSICERNEVPPADVGKLAGLLHELGQIVYYADNKELRDIVVLDPEWLTRAISRVLSDQPTRDAGGVLDHARLAQIWTDADGYPRAQHPYILSVMEKFLISYRPEGDDRKSLIAQLVPAARPELPWDTGTPVPDGKRSLRLRCRLSEPVPGLIALLTVRLRRMSTGRHWRRGVFLRHWRDDYDSEALIELRGNELAAEVRAPVPDLFFHVILDSVEELLRERWPGLRYDLMVPCTGADDRGPCASEFRLENLTRRRTQGKTTITCPECDADLRVDELLTGFAGSGTLNEYLELLPEILRGQERLEVQVTSLANSTRLLLAAANNEVTDCPRLFTLEPARASGAQRLEVHKRHYELHLWCEYPDGPHPLPGDAYPVGEPQEWFVRLRPYLRVMLKFLQVAAPVAGLVPGVLPPRLQGQGIGDSLRGMSDLLEKGGHVADAVLERAVEDDDDDDDLDGAGDQGGPARLAPAQGEALRAFRELLFRLDPHKSFGGLRRALSSTGSYLWLCPDHYTRYDRGLPVIAGSSRPEITG